jgi:hypothetical protein
MWKQQEMPEYILHFLQAMKCIGKQDGKTMMAQKTEHLYAIKKEHWEMDHWEKEPAGLNVIHQQSGQVFGEWVVIMMPVSRKMRWWAR